MKYQAQLANALVATKQALGVLVPAGVGSADIGLGPQEELLTEVTRNLGGLKTAIDTLEKTHQQVHEMDGLSAEAHYYHDEVIPAMVEVRRLADMLETQVDDTLWPLPKYREMLFIY